METRSAKRKKLLINAQHQHDHDDHRSEDIISNLPDVILHHILSLLPIKSIAQTSLLSKRWRHLWSSFPDLDFNPMEPIITSWKKMKRNSNGQKRVLSPIGKGMDFLSQVLAHRDKHSDIRRLRFRAVVSFSRLNGLIRHAVRHNVQELDLEVSTNDYFNFPRCVVACESLRVLKLKSIYPGFRLPPPLILKSGFQSLHTLSLSLIILYQQTSLLDLFTDPSFPLLKKLSLDACFGLRDLHVSCRGLEELVLENCFQLNGLHVSGPKMEKLRVSSCFDAYSVNSWVKIDAPRLKVLFWEYNAITETSCVENLSSLHEASIGFFVLHVQMDLTASKLLSVSHFLAGFSHAQCLTLETQCVEVLSKNKQFHGVLLHPFNNLRSLELRTCFNKHNVPGLACLFRNSPTLHTLVIKIIDDYKNERKQWNGDLWDLSNSEEERYWESQSQALKSFLHHLKVVEIHGFLALENDISLAMFLLKHGRVLQEMTVFLGHYNSKHSLRREKIKSQMTGFSRASSNAKIAFQ